MFARPSTEQEWFASSTIAGTVPDPVTIANVAIPRRVTRQKTNGRVRALKALMRDTVALRADWNLFGLDDEDIKHATAPRRPVVQRTSQTQIITARRSGLQIWIDNKAAERRARRAVADASFAAMAAEEATLRATLCIEDEADKPEPPTAAMQLSAHLISIALMAVALPLGVMALVCTILRGGDMRIAARMSTLTGFAILALSQNTNLLSAFAS